MTEPRLQFTYATINMKEKSLTILLRTIMFTGLIMMLTGIGLATFTNMAAQGNFMILALLIGLGMIMLAPAKIYLTFLMMQNKDAEQRRKSHER